MSKHNSVFLADLTWEEVSAYLSKQDSLIIPAGICEQHSKHLPLNTDTIIAEYIADYLSRKTGILIAPTVNYGVGLPCDKIYAGTTSIEYEDLNNTLTAIIDWWKFQGFKNFFIVTAHNDPFHMQALRNIGHPNVFVLDIYAVAYDGILEKQSSTKHAGEIETSVLLYLYPEKVRKTKIEDFETPFEEFKDYLYHLKMTPIPSSPGCQGYPSFATAEKGARIVGLIKENALNWIARYNSI
ncbi:MAG: creatininase family protein [Candidatus Neomarinimicrobiota bacterium]